MKSLMRIFFSRLFFSILFHSASLLLQICLVLSMSLYIPILYYIYTIYTRRHRRPSLLHRAPRTAFKTKEKHPWRVRIDIAGGRVRRVVGGGEGIYGEMLVRK